METVNTFSYNGYYIKILVSDADDENAGFGYEIYEYDDNNIVMDNSIFNSFKEYEYENEDQAIEDAKAWVDEYEDLSKIKD